MIGMKRFGFYLRHNQSCSVWMRLILQ